MKSLISLFFFFASVHYLQAAKVDTIEVYSAKMQKNIKTVVVQPDNAEGKTLPTVYLLHGFGGNYGSFVNRCESLKEWVDRFQLLVVCPDGGFGSWYWDSEEADFKYETFVARELTAFISKNYAVRDSPDARAVTGFSMGGHGALYLSLRNQDIFGAVGSMAGGVDFRPFPNNWHIQRRLGEYHENPEKWSRHTVIESLHLYRPKQLAIYIDCGEGDFFFPVNEKLHEKMSYLNIPHLYLVRPGKHDWNYVNQTLPYQLLFFHEFFSGKKA